MFKLKNLSTEASVLRRRTRSNFRRTREEDWDSEKASRSAQSKSSYVIQFFLCLGISYMFLTLESGFEIEAVHPSPYDLLSPFMWFWFGLSR
jgi:hypothetical protein